MATSLRQLCDLGQSPWYDNIRRSFLTSGRLRELIAGGIRGVTVNPLVFRQFNGGTKRLGFAWESCGHTAMRVLDFPSAIVVDHDISRFMQLFLQPVFIHVRQEITRGRARKFV